jgi:hypothetical protein
MEGGNKSVPSGGCSVDNWDKILKIVMHFLEYCTSLTTTLELNFHKILNAIERHLCYGNISVSGINNKM